MLALQRRPRLAAQPSRRHALLCALFAFALFAIGACAGAKPRQRPSGTLELVVLHTNDIHGQVQPRPATWVDRRKPPLSGGLPRAAAMIERVRSEERAAGRAVLVLDGGDWYQGTPEGIVELGRDFVRAIAAIDYDAVSIGNHEFDHGFDNLARLLNDARPPAICANLRERGKSERVSWVAPWRIVDAGGLRIALVGLLTPDTPSITHADARRFDFAPAHEEIGRVKAELGESVDLILPVGHIGIEEAREIARAHPELPLIVTGHSHTFLREGEREGDTLIVQAGAKASVVGRVDLALDGPSAKVLRSSAKLLELLEEPRAQDRNARVDELCASLIARADAAMREVVGELTAPLSASGKPYSTVAGSWMADLIRARTQADVAFHNRGGVRAEIDAGPVTRREVFEMSPFDNNLAILRLRGAELEALVRAAIDGRAHSGLDYSGCRVLVKEGREKLNVALTFQALEVGGKPLDPEAWYTVATNSFLAGGGDGFDVLARCPERREDPLLLRELAELELRSKGAVTPPTDARIVAVGDRP